MARASEILPENVGGNFFVDRSCIDCDTCRQISPQTFARSDSGYSFVVRQPVAADEQRQALMALVACPTASIGTLQKIDASDAARAFPEPIEDDVYYCGFTSKSSFGASSYLITRSSGNVLVDSPRSARPLMKRLAKMGGVRLMFLTHRDDVADHQAYRREFACDRVLHRADVTARTVGVERPIDGWDPVRLADDLLVIPVPGHTPGSAALLYRDEFLFTGDHLWATEEGELGASRSVCWYSWPEQVRSIERLVQFEFQWVLPGHERRFRAESPAAMRRELERLLSRLRRSTSTRSSS
jgi:glyoxylase-like metal-dependent hydrolase (beta-lactamase superfamily II)/ferredoxin